MITILQTADGKTLTKTFRALPDGTVEKLSYDKAWKFNVVEQPCSNIFELHDILSYLEHEHDMCVVRGCLKEGAPTGGISRLLHDNDRGDIAWFEEPPMGSSWMLVDFDKVPSVEGLPADLRVEYLIDQLPNWFADVTYHYRWSASAGVDGWDVLSCHVWFWLEGSWRSEDLRTRIKLEKWEGADPVVFDPVHIHYTANPIFVGMHDPLDGKRSGLVRKSKDAVALPPMKVPVRPAFVPRLRPKVGTNFDVKFQAMLDDIGPNYHVPIRSAIYFYAKHSPEPDFHELKDRVEEAIMNAPPGKNPTRNYLGSYLTRTINGALRKA